MLYLYISHRCQYISINIEETCFKFSVYAIFDKTRIPKQNRNHPDFKNFCFKRATTTEIMRYRQKVQRSKGKKIEFPRKRLRNGFIVQGGALK